MIIDLSNVFLEDSSIDNAVDSMIDEEEEKKRKNELEFHLFLCRQSSCSDHDRCYMYDCIPPSEISEDIARKCKLG